MRLKSKQVMLDLETLDTTPGGVILSVGACAFDVESGVDTEDTFYMVVDRQSSEDAGLRVNRATLLWWEKQSPEARKVLDEAQHRGYPLAYVLGCYAGWMQSHDNPPVWTNGPGFDEAFLAVAAKRVGVPAPVHFRKSRCFRTLRALFGDDVVEPMMTEGVHHNALSDAIYQAQYAVSIFRYLSPSDSK
jgi:hypothetical protein